MAIDPRRNLLADAWVQLVLVVTIVVLANTWGAHRFVRLDLTGDKLYSLDLATRSLMHRLERPLSAKVYFTGGLQAPYNNFEQIVVDKLEDMRAYSGGHMEIEVVDPTGDAEREAEARRFGITPIQYRYDSATVKELKRVYMGVALVYGDKQEVLPAITQTATLEYDLARAVKALTSDEDRKTIGWSAGFGEPNLLSESGPLSRLRQRLAERYNLRIVPLGGAGSVPDDVDAMLVVGPQRPLSERALYQLDQVLMRGSGVAYFVGNLKPDMRTLRPQRVFHGLEGLLGSYGVKVNRDVVIDRSRNGMMNMPVRQGRQVVQAPVNSPLIPRATVLDRDNLVVKDLDSMLFPFASSLEIADDLPPEIDATVLAATHPDAGRLKGLRTIAPEAFRAVLSSEEKGSWPLLVSLDGSFRSYFEGREVPEADPLMSPTEEEATEAARIDESGRTQLVVAGSADFVVNQPAFMLNLVDWMVQDSDLISIRSKTVDLPALQPVSPDTARKLKLLNLLSGSLLILVFGAVRFALRRRGAGYREAPEEAA